ncbi:MAG: hypothetical protein H0T53_16655, partial [Herpetosiphonaceae bacterium]|nr:hypothetical protein [Herpetosiphonaceae bacterium]
MTDEQLLDLRHIYRTNLANLELQAANFSELNLPVSLRNDLDASRKKLDRIDAEFRRRAGGGETAGRVHRPAVHHLGVLETRFRISASSISHPPTK